MQDEYLKLLNDKPRVNADIKPEDYEIELNNLFSLTQGGDYSSVLDCAEDLINNGFYDIRIISHFLYAEFALEGKIDI